MQKVSKISLHFLQYFTNVKKFLFIVPVAKAVTLLDYPSNDPGILSFKSNAEVTVFSKAAGKRKDLWGVEVICNNIDTLSLIMSLRYL